MATPPRLGRGDPTSSHIRWIHEDVLELLSSSISEALHKLPGPFEIPSNLTKSLYAIIGLQIVTAILLFILIVSR